MKLLWLGKTDYSILTSTKTVIAFMKFNLIRTNKILHFHYWFINSWQLHIKCLLVGITITEHRLLLLYIWISIRNFPKPFFKSSHIFLPSSVITNLNRSYFKLCNQLKFFNFYENTFVYHCFIRAAPRYRFFVFLQTWHWFLK